jgi:hypothetical protein
VSLQWLWYIVLGTTFLIAFTAVASIFSLWGLIRPTQINSSLALLAFLWVYGLAFYALRANLLHSDELRILLADLSQETRQPSISGRSAFARTASNRYSSGQLALLHFIPPSLYRLQKVYGANAVGVSGTINIALSDCCSMMQILMARTALFPLLLFISRIFGKVGHIFGKVELSFPKVGRFFSCISAKKNVFLHFYF